MKHKKINTILVLISMLMVTVGGGAYWHSTQKKAPTTEQGSAAKNDTPDSNPQVDSSDGSKKSPTTAPQSNSTPPPQPILIKSSGNNGPVPENINIEFVCQSAAGNECHILLTNKNDASRSIRLEKKIVAQNKANLNGVNWIWKSVLGSWSVTAIASNSSGKSTQSAAQTLVVQ